MCFVPRIEQDVRRTYQLFPDFVVSYYGIFRRRIHNDSYKIRFGGGSAKVIKGSEQAFGSESLGGLSMDHDILPSFVCYAHCRGLAFLSLFLSDYKVFISQNAQSTTYLYICYDLRIRVP